MLQQRLTLFVACLLLLPVGWTQAISSEFIDTNHARLDRVFSSLDPAHPAMGPLQKAWREGHELEAAKNLAAYFAGKAFDLSVLNPAFLPPDYREQARAALDWRFRILDSWIQVPSRPDGGPDWNFKGKRDDKETSWMLNRHGFLPLLAQEWVDSRDLRMSQAIDFFLSDWIRSNPYPRRLSFSESWRALEVARRILNSWVHVFYGEAGISPETRLLVLASILDHADSLRHHASFWGGNHLISEKLALLTIAWAWPEFNQSSEWAAHAIDILSRQFINQSYPDGSYKELSNHYQRVVLVNADLFLRLIGRLDPEYRERPVFARIEQMWNFFAYSMGPDGHGPLNNASDKEWNAAFVRDAWTVFDRPDWLYLATNGLEGEAPAVGPSLLFPWAGQAFLRNGWSRNADWLYFDAGPYGSAHQHIDRLHLSLSLGGNPLLVDNGRYTYRPGKWKVYFQGPDSHNTLKLNDQPAQQGPRIIQDPLPITFETIHGAAFVGAQSRFVPETAFSTLPGSSSPVPWTRTVFYDERGFVLVIDHLVTFTPQSLEANWHFHPDISKDEARNALQLVNAESFPGLQQEFLFGAQSMPIGGFHSTDYNQKEPSLRMRLSTRISQPATLFWLLQSPGHTDYNIEIISKQGAPVCDFLLKRGSATLSRGSIRIYPEIELLYYSNSSN